LFRYLDEQVHRFNNRGVTDGIMLLGVGRVVDRSAESVRASGRRPRHAEVEPDVDGTAVPKALSAFGEPKPITPVEYDLNVIREAEASKVR
jgi:hypothetical protein